MAAAPAHAPTYSLKSTLAFSSFDSSRVNSKGFSSCASVRIHPRVGRVRAGLEGESSASEVKESVQRPVVRRRKPVSTPTSPSLSDSDDPALSLETVLVEDERVSLEGVGRVDREAASSSFSWTRAGTLAAGDLVALVTFAVIGRASHGLTTLNWDALRTADPFIAGWLLGSYFLGGYGPDGQGVNGVSRAVTAALKSWAVGVPLGLVIRGIVTSHMPAQAFILVSMGSLLVLMVGWRVAYVYVFANGGNVVESKPANRSGGVFEFLELLTSLVRRW